MAEKLIFNPNDIVRPTDTPGQGIPWIQWRVENWEEMLDFLAPYALIMRRLVGNQLAIRSPVAHDIILGPGDCLIVDRSEQRIPRMGVIRVPQPDSVILGLPPESKRASR